MDFENSICYLDIDSHISNDRQGRVFRKFEDFRIYQKKHINQVVAKYDFSNAAPLKKYRLDEDIKLSALDGPCYL
jgi:hypothetical protein